MFSVINSDTVLNQILYRFIITNRKLNCANNCAKFMEKNFIFVRFTLMKFTYWTQ